jgi:type II secretory pathway pseudopilin PulG
MKNKNKINRGFTLVEMLIAVSLFIIIVTISIGSILSVFDANKKAQSSKTVVDNLNLSIENMARTVRFGTNYYCGVSAEILSTYNCSGGGDSLSVTFQGNRIIYSWTQNGPIRKSEDGGLSYTNITSSDTVIEYLRFYVFGTNASGSPDSNQPYVLAVIKGHVGSRATTQTAFSIETLMSQRTLDI